MANANKPRSRDDFHIAILTALPHESDAILEMFDGNPWRAAEYKKDERDRNEYELGYIGDHNVVAAFLGSMGSKNAQNVAESLRLSFRNIKLALVVGICGGVPIKTRDSGDILLGDTIISTQVVDLTFGRQYDDRVEIKKGVKDVFGRPPIEIQNFLHKTTTKRCRARIRENSFKYLKELCAKDDCIYPGTDKDVAYPRKYRHKHQRPEDCATCAKCIAAEAKVDEAETSHKVPDEVKEAEDAVQRITVCKEAETASCDALKCDKARMLKRGEDRPSETIRGWTVRRPAVHFGQIGSDNNVVKSGYYRDAVASEEDIIAFEMEGGGVWDTFPTMVIKGVCDYADSHKRKGWQNYAAASAAACMKALLMEWTPCDERPHSGVNAVSNQIYMALPSRSQEECLPIACKLPCAKGATFDPYKVHPTCHSETRVDLLHQIKSWAQQANSKSIFWLNGVAGTGKSTVSWTVAKWLTEQAPTRALGLGASFFFKRGELERNNASRFFPTLAQDLMSNIPGLGVLIKEVVTADEHIFDKTLGEQFDKLIFRPLQSLNIDPTGRSTFILVVDALDECGPTSGRKSQTSDIEVILSLWTQISQIKTVCLKLFLTSRPEPSIHLAFNQMPTDTYRDVILHKVPEAIIEHDISIFLRDEFSNIRNRYNARLYSHTLIEDTWPDHQVINSLTKIAVPLFIVAATVCRFVGDLERHPPRQLKKILEFQQNGQLGHLDQMEQIYLPILDQLFKGSDDEEFCEDFRNAIGSVITLTEPLSTKSFIALLQVEPGIVLHHLSALQSVLAVPADPEPIRPFHLSFGEFLLSDKMRDRPFGVDGQATHRFLSDKCLKLLSADNGLQENMCDLTYPGQLRREIDPAIVGRRLPPEFQYACRYWVHHRQHSKAQIDDVDDVYVFLQRHFLHWLEALSLMNRISETIRLLGILQSLVAVNESSHIKAFLQDAQRFILTNRYIIDLAPLQIYSSAILFAPRTSVVRKLCGRLPAWLLSYPKTSPAWSPELMKLEGHTKSVSSVAFSPDGSMLGSGSSDGMVALWDTATGQEIQKLDGHNEFVHGIAFSPDGLLLASVSNQTLSLWNLVTGHEVNKLKDRKITAIAFSSVNSRLAYGSDGGTVSLWNPTTGEEIKLEGHTKRVRSVAFSRDSSILASGSNDGTVRVWNLTTQQERYKLKYTGSYVSAVAVSQETSLLAVGTSKPNVGLWNLDTGQIIRELKGHLSFVNSVTFSHDGSRLASGSFDRTVILWDAITGQMAQVFSGHTSIVNSIAISPNGLILASGSYDQTVTVWDLTTDHASQILEGHLDWLTGVATSEDGTVVASRSPDRTIRLWDPKTSQELLKLEGHTQQIFDLAFSPDGLLLAFVLGDHTIRLWTGSLLVSTSANKAIELWKSTEAKELRKLSAPNTGKVAFSQNGSLLASVGFTNIITLWNTATGLTVQTLDAHTKHVQAVAFSQDASRLASGSDDGTVTVWNLETSQKIRQLKGHTLWITAVAFSPDGLLVASGSEDKTIRLWDLVTDQVQILENMPTISSISLTVDKNTIITNKGDISVDSETGMSPTLDPSIRRTSIVKNDWIQYNGRNYLWLPQEYRAAYSAFCDGMFSFGLHSGQVRFVQFSK